MKWVITKAALFAWFFFLLDCATNCASDIWHFLFIPKKCQLINQVFKTIAKKPKLTSEKFSLEMVRKCRVDSSKNHKKPRSTLPFYTEKPKTPISYYKKHDVWKITKLVSFFHNNAMTQKCDIVSKMRHFSIFSKTVLKMRHFFYSFQHSVSIANL